MVAVHHGDLINEHVVNILQSVPNIPQAGLIRLSIFGEAKHGMVGGSRYEGCCRSSGCHAYESVSFIVGIEEMYEGLDDLRFASACHATKVHL